MSEFSKQLLKAMQIRGIKQNELCNMTGIPKSAMSQYMSGKFKPKQTRTFLIAKALNVNETWLMGCDDIPMNKVEGAADNSLRLSDAHIFMRPVFNDSNSAFGIGDCSEPEGYLPTYIPDSVNVEKYIWINISDESMAPLIDLNSRVLVMKQPYINSGQIAVILIDGKNSEIKKVIYENDYVELQSVNPYFPSRKFVNDEASRVLILGVVKEINKTLL